VPGRGGAKGGHSRLAQLVYQLFYQVEVRVKSGSVSGRGFEDVKPGGLGPLPSLSPEVCGY